MSTSKVPGPFAVGRADHDRRGRGDLVVRDRAARDHQLGPLDLEQPAGIVDQLERVRVTGIRIHRRQLSDHRPGRRLLLDRGPRQLHRGGRLVGRVVAAIVPVVTILAPVVGAVIGLGHAAARRQQDTEDPAHPSRHRATITSAVDGEARRLADGERRAHRTPSGTRIAREARASPSGIHVIDGSARHGAIGSALSS
jgi:hypothetical protein